MIDLYETAKVLAHDAEGYSTVVVADRLTDGTRVFVASCPELPGCKSQGVTTIEAVTNLADARIEYIYSLLIEGREVPLPSQVEVI